MIQIQFHELQEPIQVLEVVAFTAGDVDYRASQFSGGAGNLSRFKPEADDKDLCSMLVKFHATTLERPNLQS